VVRFPLTGRAVKRQLQRHQQVVERPVEVYFYRVLCNLPVRCLQGVVVGASDHQGEEYATVAGVAVVVESNYLVLARVRRESLSQVGLAAAIVLVSPLQANLEQLGLLPTQRFQ
jgi:hypothetical protein